METTTTRVNKYLALQLGISRREADELIEKGSVQINNQVASLGSRVSSTDTVTVHGKPVATDTQHRVILFHKPVGYVCSRKAQGSNPTIYDLLPPDMHPLKPAGRLDKDSSGLLLLTNDGDLAHQMMHPSFHKTKVYEVQLDKPLAPLHQQMISDYGVQLEDGLSTFLVATIDQVAPAAANSAQKTYQITMHEGRNRQIRRTFAALGYTVTKLHRTQFGTYQLGSLQQAETRVLD